MKTIKVSINPYTQGQEETSRKGLDELLNNLTPLFLIGNKLPKVGKSVIPFGDSDAIGVSFEYKAQYNDLSFYVDVPDNLESSITSSIQSIFPVSDLSKEGETEHFKKLNILKGDNFEKNKNFEYKEGTFIFANNEASLITTSKEKKIDYFHSILSMMSGMDKNTICRYKVSFVPATNYWKHKIFARDHEENNREASSKLFGQKKNSQVTSFVRAKLDNLSKEKGGNSTGYFVVIRYFIAGKKEETKNIKEEINLKYNSIKDFLGGLANDLSVLKEIKEGNSFYKNYYGSIVPSKAINKGSLLVDSELITLVHLPIPLNMKVQNLDIQTFQKLPMAKELIKNNASKEDVIFGENTYGGNKNLFLLDHSSRFRHVYALGKSGTGKSTLITTGALQDIYDGHGCCVFDPHGDLIEDIMKHFPDPRNPKYKDRWKDLIYIDFSDKERSIGLNILEADDKYDETIVVNSFMGLLKKMFPDGGESMGAYFENYIRNIMPTIMGIKNCYKPTLPDIVRILSVDTYRNFAINNLDYEKELELINFWEAHEKQTGEGSNSSNKAEIIPHISTKFAPFLGNEYVKAVTSQPHSTIDFGEAMNTNKIILVKLAKGKIGEDNMRILGLILIQKLLTAVFKRDEIPEEDRVPFFLYVDEFQNFITKEFESILSEARKYKFGLTMANQYLHQLIDKSTKDESIQKGVFGNAGTFISFQVGSDDIHKLEEQFGDKNTLPKESFSNIEKYYAYCKTGGSSDIKKNLPPFHIKTVLTDKPQLNIRDEKGKIVLGKDGKPQLDRKLIESIINKSKDKYYRTSEARETHEGKFNRLFSGSLD